MAAPPPKVKITKAVANAGEKGAEAEGEAPKRKIPMWMIIAGASQIVVIGIIAVFFVIFLPKKPEAKTEGVGQEVVTQKDDVVINPKIAMKYGPIKINVNVKSEKASAKGEIKHVLIEFMLVMSEPDDSGVIDVHLDRIRDFLIEFLSSKSFEAMNGPDAQDVLGDEVAKGINQIIKPIGIRRVHISNFVAN